MPMDSFEKRMEHLKQSYEQMPSHSDKSRMAVIRRLERRKRQKRSRLHPMLYAASILFVFLIGGVLAASTTDLFGSRESADPSLLSKESEWVPGNTPTGDNSNPGEGTVHTERYQENGMSEGQSSEAGDSETAQPDQNRENAESSEPGNKGNSGETDSEDSDTEKSNSGETSDDSDSSSPNSGNEEAQTLNEYSSKAVIQKSMQTLETSVPKVAPTNIPINDGLYLTSNTKAASDSYEVRLYQVSQPIPINSPKNLEKVDPENQLGVFGGTLYEDQEKAAGQVRYFKVENGNLDIGYDIMAREGAGAGHVYISWNEGRWLFQIDSPTNPDYLFDGYGTRKEVAKNIVAFLEENWNPPPPSDQYGYINVSLWKDSHGITIRWQEDRMVYHIQTHQSPLAGMKMAVSRKDY
ncbi:MAG TPA: hypothetical protein VFT51_09530 [Bacillales bacterium]|nr:hypothetical protein [Bacillales bacterium]